MRQQVMRVLVSLASQRKLTTGAAALDAQGCRKALISQPDDRTIYWIMGCLHLMPQALK
jgi:hypothetical protein